MSATDRVVYQFPISHYCEKTRWNLDAKGLSYKVRDLIPGIHMLIAWRTAGIRTVPILVDGSTVVGDSAAISKYLERAYPDRPLLPADTATRARALDLEAYFSDRVGPRVRQLAYGHLLAARRGSAAEAMFRAYPGSVRLYGKVMGPLIEQAIKSQYRLGPEATEKGRLRVLEALDRIERETNGEPSSYLAGDRLSLADITAASVLAPLVAPPGSPWSEHLFADHLPEALRALRAEIAGHPGVKWVEARYAERTPERKG